MYNSKFENNLTYIVFAVLLEENTVSATQVSEEHTENMQSSDGRVLQHMICIHLFQIYFI